MNEETLQPQDPMQDETMAQQGQEMAPEMDEETGSADMSPDQAAAALAFATNISEQMHMPQQGEEMDTEDQEGEVIDEEVEPEEDSEENTEEENKEMTKEFDKKIDDLRSEMTKTIKEEMKSIREDIKEALQDDEQTD